MIELLNCDCMEYMKGLEGNAFDLAIVDPPYGIDYDKQQNKMASSGREGNGGKWKGYKQTEWDANIPDGSYFDEIKRVSSNQIIWGGNYYPIDLSGVIVWDKGENGTLPHGELAKTNIKTFKIFKMSRADAYINNPSLKIHPTQKPVKLYEWLLTSYAKEGDRILDTHLGSGSSAIAAHYAGFDFVGMEIDKDYYGAAVKRFNSETAQVDMFGGCDP
ncbi:MAG: site-specific DNA-methyltransferase [Gammaproteobacteria bacterium]|nr:site-specific DNA-methyltransferase [Gammaproteobacteria bacterium]